MLQKYVLFLCCNWNNASVKQERMKRTRVNPHYRRYSQDKPSQVIFRLFLVSGISGESSNSPLPFWDMNFVYVDSSSSQSTQVVTLSVEDLETA